MVILHEKRGDFNLVFLSLAGIFILYIILMNLFLIIAILRDINTRGRLFFKLILLIAVAQFLQGVLVIPLHIEIGFSGGKWIHDPDICTFWHLTDLTLIVVLVILFLMLMFERFFSLTYPQMTTNNCLSLIMLLSPWILSTAYVVFLYYALPATYVRTIIDVIERTETVDTCTVGYYIYGIYSFFGFLCPAAFVFGFSWANVVILCLLRRRYAERPSEHNPRSHTSASSVVAIFFIAMWFPSNSRLILPEDFYRYVSMTTVMYLGFANAALTPTLWLILPVMKHSFRRLCCCCCIACCCPYDRRYGGVVSSAVDESRVRMLGNERVQPSYTTEL